LRYFRSVIRYIGNRDEQLVLRGRIKDIAAIRIRYGYKRIHILLQREGWQINHKRVYRPYKEEGLTLRHKRPRRHITAKRRDTKEPITSMNQCWSLDFVSDALYDGKKIRALPVLDVFTRERLAIEVDHGIRGEQVVAVLDQIAAERGAPAMLRCDNGPEFISKVFDK
jgi:putative transposase